MAENGLAESTRRVVTMELKLESQGERIDRLTDLTEEILKTVSMVSSQQEVMKTLSGKVSKVESTIVEHAKHIHGMEMKVLGLTKDLEASNVVIEGQKTSLEKLTARVDELEGKVGNNSVVTGMIRWAAITAGGAVLTGIVAAVSGYITFSPPT